MENLFVYQRFEISGSRVRNILTLALFCLATVTIFDIGQLSLSFIFGALLLVLSLNNYIALLIPRRESIFLFVFVFIALISTVISEVPADRTTLFRMTQLIYWLFLSITIFNSYEGIKKAQLSGIVFLSVILFLVIDLFVFPMAQNAVAFTAIIMGPLGLYFLRKFYLQFLYVILLMYLMLLNGSRTGAILCFLQAVLFFLLFTPVLKRGKRLILILIFLLAISINFESARIAVGERINPLNSRVGELLINPEEVFRNDMSWLQRRAQINKGKEIFEKHPLLGIGIFNFPSYGINIDITNIETDRKSIRNIDNRSAHNAYIALLSETGILGLTSILLMFAIALRPFLTKLNYLGGTFEGCVFISLIGLLGYFYLISGFFGSSSWLIYGLIIGASNTLRENKLTYSYEKA